MTSSNECQHHFGVRDDTVEWTKKWCRKCHLCGGRNIFAQTMAKCKSCREVFVHERCLLHAAEVAGLPSVVGCNRVVGFPESLSATVPQPPVDPRATFTVHIELASKIVVSAPQSWQECHRVSVPAACTGAFTVHPAPGGSRTSTRSVVARVEIVTTVEVTDWLCDDVTGGRIVVQKVDIRSEATTSVVSSTVDGSPSDDLVHYDVTWMAYIAGDHWVNTGHMEN